jgi:hypothetical protein
MNMNNDTSDETQTFSFICDLCGAQITTGQELVTVSWQREKFLSDDSVEVLEANTIVTLCVACGTDYPATNTRVLLGCNTFVGSE